MGDGRTSDGAAQVVLTRDQHDPTGPLVRRRITRTYQRTAYALQVLTLRDEDGNEQTLRVTEEHPFYVDPTGWTPAKSLESGDMLLGADGTLTVVANEHEAHPNGVTVYNLEVEQAHTYFVLAEDANDAAAVWVHNADYRVDVAARTRIARKQYGLSRGQHAELANARILRVAQSNESFAASLQAMVGKAGMKRLASGRTPRGWVWHHVTRDQASGQAGWLALVRDQDHRRLSSMFHPNGHGGYLEWAVPAGAPRT